MEVQELEKWDRFLLCSCYHLWSIHTNNSTWCDSCTWRQRSYRCAQYCATSTCHPISNEDCNLQLLYSAVAQSSYVCCVDESSAGDDGLSSLSLIILKQRAINRNVTPPFPPLFFFSLSPPCRSRTDSWWCGIVTTSTLRVNVEEFRITHLFKLPINEKNSWMWRHKDGLQWQIHNCLCTQLDKSVFSCFIF